MTKRPKGRPRYTGPRRKPTAFKLPVPLLARLKAFAVTTGRQQADIVAVAVERYLDKETPKNGSADTIRDLAKRLEKMM